MKLPIPSTALFALALLPVSAARGRTLAPLENFLAEPPSQDASAASQDPAGFGPLDPAPPSGGLTPEAIVQKMGERESEFAHARDAYTFRQNVKVQTISEDNGRPDGEYAQITDVVFNKDGGREEHVVFAPQNTLERVMMSPADFEDIEHRLPFVLTTQDLPQYNVTYLGRQKVDSLDTYVFSAAPKTIVKNHRYFQGKVWLDQQDLEIVLINGKSVPDDKRKGHEDLSPPFTTYYEQVDGKYWFPTYTKAEGDLHFDGGSGYMSQNVHLRTIVKYNRLQALPRNQPHCLRRRRCRHPATTRAAHDRASQEVVAASKKESHPPPDSSLREPRLLRPPAPPRSKDISATPHPPTPIIRMICREVCRLNGLGSRSRCMSVSSCSSWLPLRRLQLWQHATRFSHVLSPPRERGITWSQRQFTRRQHHLAVLAHVAVAQQDVFA